MIQSLLIDLDGTLTDPKRSITRCIQHALPELGREAADMDDLIWCIDPPLINSFKTLLDDPVGELAAQAVALYRERFGEVSLYENDIYDGVTDLLAEHAGKGRKIIHFFQQTPRLHPPNSRTL